MTEEKTTNGGCLCGQVTYAFKNDPLFTALCHCKNCQRQSGSAFSIVIGVLRADYVQTGDCNLYLDESDDGRQVERHFCGACGSPVISVTEAMPDMMIIKAGTLDQPESLSPTIEVFCDRAMPFLPRLKDTETFSKSNI